MLGEHPNLSQSRDIAPKLENINLSYFAQNHSCVTTLKLFIFRLQMNTTAEFQLPSIIQS